MVALPAKNVDTEYLQSGTVAVAADQEIVLSCTGVTDIAVTALGARGTMLAFSTLFVSALVLVGWGVIASTRSRGPGKLQRHEWF